MLKRAQKGTFHKLSPKCLDRYVQEFAGRHNMRERNTADQIATFCTSMERKRLRYADLIADTGDVRVNATLEELTKAVVQPVKVRYIKSPKRNN